MNLYNSIKKYPFLRSIYNYKQYLKNKSIKEDSDAICKIFVIGLNKTGTTSIKKALDDFGYQIGNQIDAELLTENTLKGDYKYLKEYIKTAEAFQDQPFSWRNIYKFLHKVYPNAKFILTIRKDCDTWYDSLINFTKARFKKNNIEIGDTILLKDFKKITYRYKNMSYNISKLVWQENKNYSSDENVLFDEDYCKYYYNKHIKEASEYFKGSNNFLILNIEDLNAYKTLCTFLDKQPLYDKFPHLNKTRKGFNE